MEEKTFAEKHPRINMIIGIGLLLGLLSLGILLLKWMFLTIGVGIDSLIEYVKKFVSTTDKVIVVAMITGSVSIIGVVISSIVAKIVEYRYNVKKILVR